MPDDRMAVIPHILPQNPLTWSSRDALARDLVLKRSKDRDSDQLLRQNDGK